MTILWTFLKHNPFLSAFEDIELISLTSANSPAILDLSSSNFWRAAPAYATLPRSKPPVPPRLPANPIRRRFNEAGHMEDSAEAVYSSSVVFDAQTNSVRLALRGEP